jgi:short-subunit dehydrogenase
MIFKKNILITGGSSGIGKHLAASLLKNNNKVVIASNNHSGLQDAVSELRNVSPNIFSCFVDVNSIESVRSLSEMLLSEHECPDILVNCAGFATYRTFEESPIDEIERLVGVNLLGAMRCTHAFLPMMIARRSGSIVNIASIAGKLVMTPNGVYSASKHGLVVWSETLKYELARFNINVSVICPGRVETAFFDHETFRTRVPRAETQLTIPIEEVCQKTISAMEKNNFLTFIPSYYGLLIWFINTFSFFSKPIYGKLLSSRIESFYAAENESEHSYPNRD